MHIVKQGIFSMGKNKHWIQDAVKKPGALRKTLGIKKGKKITKKQLEKAAKSKSSVTKKRVALAKTLSKLRKK